jgi:hypothetical protein
MSPKNASVASRMFLEPRGFSLNSFNSFKVKFYTRVIVYLRVLLWNLMNLLTCSIQDRSDTRTALMT